MAAKKGVPNPNAGRPKGAKNAISPDIKLLARKYANEAIETVFNVMKKSKIESNRIAAAQILMDRGFGKPTQQMGVDPDQPTGKFTISWEK
jgi:hypothetical protein